MGKKEWEAENVFDVFGDDLARHILVLALQKPVSADELARRLEVSSPTIYRRLNTLSDYDLLREEFQIDGDGNHYRTFETTLKRVTFELDSGGCEINVTLRRNIVDRFEAFWEELDRSSPAVGLDRSETPDRDRTRAEGHDG